MAARLADLGQTWDAWTISHLEACGIRPGWRCLEVGAGAGSIAAWMADRVGPTGHVLATDIEPQPALASARPNLEIRRHDITAEPVPDSGFDLVHSRLVLQHLRPRRRVVGTLVKLLRPGGWICLEDFAEHRWIDPVADPESLRLLRKAMRCMPALIRKRGGDPRVGRKLVPWLVAAGIRPVHAEAVSRLPAADSPAARLVPAALRRAESEILQGGLLTPDEFAKVLALMEDPQVLRYTPLMLGAWGPRPA